jgi:hypothetical protein
MLIAPFATMDTAMLIPRRRLSISFQPFFMAAYGPFNGVHRAGNCSEETQNPAGTYQTCNKDIPTAHALRLES